jgi:hypothetical protein
MSRGLISRRSQCHLLEREEKVGSRLDPDGSCGDLRKIALSQQGPERLPVQRLILLFVRVPLIASFPIQISLVLEASREESTEFAAGAQ